MMLKKLVQSLAIAALWQDVVIAGPTPECAAVNAFVKKQRDVSFKGVLANIGGGGARAPGAAPGVVIASPSRADPDCEFVLLFNGLLFSNAFTNLLFLDYFTWTRDAALTLKVLVESFIHGDKSLRPKIEDYITAQAKLQTVSNPSGSPDAGGLGEPKFHVDLTEFTGPWGRPQRDGPPLRATALVLYSNWLIANGGRAEAVNRVWPIIAKDLSYTVRYWNRTGFDLWEEVNGSSFFTLSATHRALVEGAALAKTLNKPCPDCAVNIPRVLCFMQRFWADGFIDSNINVKEGRTGKDANSILSSIHTFDPKSKCTDSTFQPCSAKALLNHKAVVDSFRSIYTINKNRGPGKAAAVGRYSEDVYFNGNPWYLSTHAAAEQLYSAIHQWNYQGAITITDVSLPFFKDLLPNSAVGTYSKSSKTFGSIIKAVSTYADDFITVSKTYTPADGALAEQFDRNTGVPLSAVHLTWSYASFIGATDRRAGVVGPSWGESTANKVPAVCEAAPSCDATMTFNVRVTTVPGETIILVGSITELKNWTPADGIVLDASKYTIENPVWSVTVKIPAETIFEYKFIKKSADGTINWESDPNHRSTSSKGCGSTGTINDVFR